MRGTVFDIQTYALYDGPGIRTAVYLKGCPLKCAWCHNPESQARDPEMAWWAERCVGCGACVKACPHGALGLEPAHRVRRSGARSPSTKDRAARSPMARVGTPERRPRRAGSPVRDQERCVACGACVKACPGEAQERIGYEIGVDALVERVARDRDFFEDSGGGVTFTGGEPTLQDEFLLAALEAFRGIGIHTALETCGAFAGQLVGPLVDAVDLFLFDLKHADEARHREGTGAGNSRIVENFAALVKRVGAERVVPRVPVVPGFNADDEAIQGLRALLEASGFHGEVQLMPYHGMARGKYERLGRDGAGDAEPLGDDDRRRIEDDLAGDGLQVVWGG